MNKQPNKAGTMAKVLARATGFWKTVSPLAQMVAFAAMSATALADYTTGTVSGLTAKQRYPWNGKVDISFTLSGPESGYCIAITATNTATGAEIPVCTLHDKAGNAVTRKTKFVPGAMSLVWDAMADKPGVLVEAITLSIVTVPPGVQLWEGGPIWAETNIGADEPWEYGLYFWWGDTIGYRREGDTWVASDGSSLNFSFDSGNIPTYEKNIDTLLGQGWITTDGALAPEHDAAQAHWGGGWRMPTKQELAHLNDNCNWSWKTQNGVNGYVVRGRGGYSQASIFIPAAGKGDGTSLHQVGMGGYYWSSVPCSDISYFSWDIDFYSSDLITKIVGTESSYRYYGSSVRPVLAAIAPSACGDTITLSFDTRTEPQMAESIDIAWDASWIGGDAEATVAISDNSAEVGRVTGTGEFTHSPTGAGRHELTYTTYIGGVAQTEVYRAVIFKDWKYKVVNDGATITDTALKSGMVVVPSEIDGYPVRGVAASMFSSCDGLTSLFIPLNLLGDFANANIPTGCAVIAPEAVKSAGAAFSWAAVSGWSMVADASAADGYVLRSNSIEAGETAAIEATVDGPGRLGFDWRISANRGDYARFYVDGVQRTQIKRSTAWAGYSAEIEGDGVHSVRWEYEHRASVATNDNAVFLDNIGWHPAVTFTVASATGVPSPSIGDHGHYWGDEIVASAANPVPGANTRVVCSGWTGTGSAPATGTGTNVTFSISEDSSITWLWRTEHRISLATLGALEADFSEAWIEEGMSVVVPYVITASYAELALSGDVAGVTLDETKQTLTIPADRPRSIVLRTTQTLTLEEALDSEGLVWTTDENAEWTVQFIETNDGVDATVSAAVDPQIGGVSGIQTVVQGPGTLCWNWKLVAEDVSGLDVIVDGDFNNPARAYEESGGWAEDSLTFDDDGTHTIRFEFWNFGNLESDCAYLDMVSWTPDGGDEGESGAALHLSQALDNDNLVFSVPIGDEYWVIQDNVSHDGEDAVRCDGTMSAFPCSPILSTAVIGPGEISFWWKVYHCGSGIFSFEFSDETDEGIVHAYINDSGKHYYGSTHSEIVTYINDDKWNKIVHQVGEGRHTFKWLVRFQQYAAGDTINLEDNTSGDTINPQNGETPPYSCGWLDQVMWTPASPIPQLATNAAPDMVTNAIASAGFVQSVAATLQDTIGGDAEKYNEFKTWAQAVTNGDGEAAGEAAVVASERAAISYLLGTDTLIANDIESDDVHITGFSIDHGAENDGGEMQFSFEITIDGVEIGSSAAIGQASLKENLRKAIGIEGSARLDGEFSSENIELTFDAPVDGKARFTATPPPGAGDSFFIRAKVIP